MPATGYSRVQITLHWLIVLLLLVSYVSSDGMGRQFYEHIRGDALAGSGGSLHIYTGMVVLGLVVIRLGVRLLHRVPPLPEDTPPWMERASVLTHWGLYLLLAVIPVTGLLAWYGEIRSFGELHSLLFDLLFVLAGLHAAAALFHQYVLKDDLLMRMIRPRQKAPKPQAAREARRDRGVPLQVSRRSR